MPESAGRALAERLAFEAALTLTTERALADFLRGVRLDAVDALVTPGVLLAALDPQPRAFTLGAVLGRWDVFVAAFATRLERLLGTSQPTTDYLARVEARLRRSVVASQAYESTRAVLRASLEHDWDRARTQRALSAALAPSAQSVIEIDLTAAGLTWDAILRSRARTEATAAYGVSTLRRLSREGFTQKRWVSHHDEVTRPTHLAVDGITIPLHASFMVGGFAMSAPADPGAPPVETENCRCTIIGVR